jgi:hypothetical protein
VRDRGLVPLDRAVDRHLRGVAEPAHRLPRRGDRDPQVKHRRDQRDHPDQRPALVLAIAGGSRPLVKAGLQPRKLLVRQLRIRP